MSFANLVDDHRAGSGTETHHLRRLLTRNHRHPSHLEHWWCNHLSLPNAYFRMPFQVADEMSLCLDLGYPEEMGGPD